MVELATFLVVALLVIPPLAAVVMGGSFAGVAPLRHLDIIRNTLVLAAGATIGAVLVGGGLALALASDVPGQAMLERLVVMPLYLTPLLTAIGWNWLGSPHSGLLNLLMHGVGVPLTINVVSPAGVILVTALSAVPLPFLFISDALHGIDPSLREAALVHGATPAQALRRITLPLLLPAGLAAALLVMVQAVGMFSIPAVLGLPAGFSVATTQIYQLLDSYPPRIGAATSWGFLLLLVSTALLLLQAALLGRRSFATISGRGRREVRRVPLGWLRAACGWLYVVPATFLSCWPCCGRPAWRSSVPT